MSRRFRHGLVLGKFAPLHRGHGLLIETALAECDRVSLWAYSNPDFPAMQGEVRSDWLRALYPGAEVLPSRPLEPPPNSAPDGVHRSYVQRVLEHLGLRVDVVFTSEDYGQPLAAVLGIQHRLVDRDRKAFPVSGSEIRRDVHAARAWLDPRVYAHFVERVVLLGAESTGKSTLTERLAGEFGTAFVPEYGRTLHEEKNGELVFEDFLRIGREQRRLEDRAILGASRYLFCDTNAITTAMFSFIFVRRADPELLRLADECGGRYPHAFVCADDFGHVQDGWRANTPVRSVHQSLVLYDLTLRRLPYTLLTGTLDERVAQVKAALAREAARLE